MKRRISTILSFTVVFALFFAGALTNAQAQACDNDDINFTIELSGTPTSIGDTFTAFIRLNDGMCIQSASVSIEYDDTLLDVISVSGVTMSNGGIFPNPTVQAPASPSNVISRDIANLGSAVGTSAPISGRILQIEFEVIGNGSSDLAFVGGNTGFNPRVIVNLGGGTLAGINNIDATNQTISVLDCNNDDANFTIVLDQASYFMGDTVEARVRINDASCFDGAVAEFEFNDTIVSLNGVTAIDDTDGGVFDNPSVSHTTPVANRVNVEITNSGGPAGFAGPVSGDLFLLEFTALADGNSPLDFVSGMSGFKPQLNLNDGMTTSTLDNVDATNAMINVNAIFACDNSAIAFDIDPSSSTIAVGSSITKTIRLNDAACIENATVELEFNDTLLSVAGSGFVNQASGGIFDAFDGTIDVTGGSIEVNVSNLIGPVGTSGAVSGALFFVEFNVIDEGMSDVEFVAGSAGTLPSVGVNNNMTTSTLDNVASTGASIEGIAPPPCDNDDALFAIELAQTTFNPGDTFDAYVTLSDVACVQSASVELEINSSVLSIVSVSSVDGTQGGIFPNPTAFVDNSTPASIISADVSNLSGAVGTSGPVSGRLLHIEFQANAPGSSNIAFVAGSGGDKPQIGIVVGTGGSIISNVDADDASVTVVSAVDVTRLIDDFNDGDFTNNPQWISTEIMGDSAFEIQDLGGGNFAVCSNSAVSSGTLMTQSNIFNHWKFSTEFMASDPAFSAGKILLSDAMVNNINEPFTGYYLSFDENGEAVIYRKGGQTGTGVALGAGAAIPSGASIQVVRNDDSTFYLFASTDTDFTTVDWSSIDFVQSFSDSDTGIYNANFTGFYFDEIGSGSVCFDNVDHGIPAAVLHGVNGETNAHLLASPVMNTTYADLYANFWTQGFMGSDLPGATSNIYVYDETLTPRNPVLGGSYLPPNAISNRVGTRSDSQSSAGKGNLSYIFDAPGFEGVYNGWPKVIEVDGTPNSGDVNVPLSFTSTSVSGEDGWHIAGNPYLRTLLAQQLLMNSANVFQTVYVWDQKLNGGMGDYRFFVTGTGGTLTNGHIAPFQGFWVKANSTGSSELRFRENQQVSGDGAEILQEIDVRALTFRAEAGEISSTMMIAFNNEAENGRDIFDAFKLSNANEQFLSIYTRNTDGDLLVVNSIPEEQEQEIRIPVYLNSNFTSSATLHVDGMESFDSSWNFSLLDTRTNQTIELNRNSNGFTVQPNMIERDGGNTPIGSIVSEPNDQAAFVFIANNGEMDNTQELPEKVTLSQNYPNPFNPSTQIRFEIPAQSEVRLDVFDVMGRQVATLLNQQMSAGEHTVTWDATNQSSGIYLYRITVGNVILTRKMSLIK